MPAIFVQALKVMKTYCLLTIAPHVRESKTVLDSGLHKMDSRFQIPDSRYLIPVFALDFNR